MAYVIKLKRSNNSMAVKHVTRNVTLQHVGRRGAQGIQGIQGPPGSDADALVSSVNGEQGDVVLDTDDILEGTNKYVTAAEKTKLSNLSGVNTGDQDLSGYVLTSRTVNSHPLSSNVTVTKSDVGLSNVDNTSDANKPVSTATQTGLNAKANDSDVVHDTGAETIAGIKTFSSDPLIPDEAYGVGWNGVLEPPTKNALYDKIETLGSPAWGGIIGTLSDQTDLQTVLDTIPTELDDLSDVTIDTPLDGQVVRYESGGWLNTQVEFADIGGSPASNGNLMDEFDLKADLTYVDDQLDKKQAKVSVAVGLNGDTGYVTDGTADDVQLNAALSAVHTAGGGIVEITSALTLANIITLYPDVILLAHGDRTVVSISAGFGAGVVFRENSGAAHYQTILDLTLDLAGKADVGGIHIYQGDFVYLRNVHVKNQTYSVASKWAVRIGNYTSGSPAGTASHGSVIENLRVTNCDCGTYEQLLFINQQDARIVNPYFESNTNSLAYELMLYINNKNVVVENPHFETPNAHSIGMMESDGIIINSVTANHDDNFKLFTIINTANVLIDGVEANNSVATPTNTVVDFFDRTLGPDGFTQIVEDTVNLKFNNINIRGWKHFISCQIGGTVLGTDYTMNQSNVQFNNVTIQTSYSSPFIIGIDNVANNLHDWDFNNVKIFSWSGANVGAYQLRGYSSAVGQMYNFRFRNGSVVPSTGGGSYAAIRAIGMTVQLVQDVDVTGTFTSYGALSTATGGIISQVRNHKVSTAAPTVSSDVTIGYGPGSRWYDTTNSKEYVCLSGTAGAAVWKLTSLTAGTDYYAPGGTDVAIADGGTGASTAAAAFTALKQDASTTATGVVELATDAETITGTDTARGVTPSNITAKMDTDGTLAGNLDTRIPTQKAVKTYADTKQPLDTDLTTIAGLTATTDNFLQAKSSVWASRTPAQVLADLAAVGTTFQPLDSDLTTIAGLTATTDNFLVSVSSAWASRTPSQVRTTLALVIGTNVQAWDADLDTWATKTAPSGTVLGTTDTQTLSNKAITRRINSTASSATPAINTDTTDQFNITALAAAITSMTSSLTGTPVDGQRLTIRIKDNGSARTIAWGASFISSGSAALPAITVASKTHMVGLVYDAVALVWVCMASDPIGY